jgi:glycosyltransferase involved in cell wall biosynthesis
MLVSICVITYRRPEGLRRLLDGLNELTFEKMPAPNIEVIVVDNDQAGAAREYCEQIREGFRWGLNSIVESRRGISFARNCSIASASKLTDFFALIDDDEVPDPSWLDELLVVQQKHSADVVTGPVVPRFENENVGEWVKKGAFFAPERHDTGSVRRVAFTNNVLFRSGILQTVEKVFDERFALSGGEDTDFFMRAFKNGASIVWADDAIVREWIPNARTNANWILRRGYRTWGSHSLIEKELYPSFGTIALRVAKGTGLIGIGIVLFLPALFRGKHAVVRALLNIARGAGTFSGLLGLSYREYAK